VKRLILKAFQVAAAVGIYAVLLWYGISIFEEPDKLDIAIITLTSLGVTYGASVALFKSASEFAGGFMVIAAFLNRHLLEPQKQRLLQQGRSQERAEIRARLKKLGLNPDDILPTEETDNNENKG
jgi:hypothetical protein